jgi:hypothetical protein
MPLQAWLWRMLKWTPTDINLVPVPGVEDRQITINDVAKGFADTWNFRCTHVLYTMDGGNARFTFDGTDPVTGARGHLFLDGAHGTWPIELVQAARFVRDGAAPNPTIRITQVYGRR